MCAQDNSDDDPLLYGQVCRRCRFCCNRWQARPLYWRGREEPKDTRPELAIYLSSEPPHSHRADSAVLWKAGIPGFRAGCDLLKAKFPDKYAKCSTAHRNKRLFVLPAVLRAAGIPVFGAEQTPGTYILTWPSAFHQGVNAGFSISAAYNLDAKDLPKANKSDEVCQKTCEKYSVNAVKLEQKFKSK